MNAALALLCSRRSVGPGQLAAPAPDDEQLAMMVEAALHAPDHAELVPFRFKVVRGDAAREELASLFAQAAVRAGKTAEGVAMDRERAARPPMTLALLARIDSGHPLVPVHEQWIAVGAALGQFMSAAHALGFGAKVLSGAKVRDPQVQARFAALGEQLVGWIVVGTPVARAVGHARPARPDKATVQGVCSDWI